MFDNPQEFQWKDCSFNSQFRKVRYCTSIRASETGVSEAIIQSINLRLNQKFYYLFDWGDEWWNEVTFEGVKDIRIEDLPAVIVARGESPPQYPDYDEED